MKTRTEAAHADCTSQPMRNRHPMAPRACTETGQILQFADRSRLQARAPSVAHPAETRTDARGWRSKALDHAPWAFAALLFVTGFGTCLLRLAGLA